MWQGPYWRVHKKRTVNKNAKREPNKQKNRSTSEPPPHFEDRLASCPKLDLKIRWTQDIVGSEGQLGQWTQRNESKGLQSQKARGGRKFNAFENRHWQERNMSQYMSASLPGYLWLYLWFGITLPSVFFPRCSFFVSFNVRFLMFIPADDPSVGILDLRNVYLWLRCLLRLFVCLWPSGLSMHLRWLRTLRLSSHLAVTYVTWLTWLGDNTHMYFIVSPVCIDLHRPMLIPTIWDDDCKFGACPAFLDKPNLFQTKATGFLGCSSCIPKLVDIASNAGSTKKLPTLCWDLERVGSLGFVMQKLRNRSRVCPKIWKGSGHVSHHFQPRPRWTTIAAIVLSARHGGRGGE